MKTRSSDGLASIGDVAERFRLRPSALRFYEEKGLIAPAARKHGRRQYGEAQIRRIALILMWRQEGLLSLDDIGTMFDPAMTCDGWRGVLRARARALEDEKRVAQSAGDGLRHFMNCPSDNPLKTCPYIRRDIDAMLGFRDEGHRIIGALARQLELRASAIRYYEGEKLLTSIRVGGRRHYGEDELRRLGFIVLCRQTYHMSLDDIAVMVRDDVTHAAWQEVLRRRLAILDAQMARSASAVQFLHHWLTCPGDDSLMGCPSLARSIDEFLDMYPASG